MKDLAISTSLPNTFERPCLRKQESPLNDFTHGRFIFTDKHKARFWMKVNKDGPIPSHKPELGMCWNWIGAKSTQGYGLFALDRKHPAMAHRVAYQLCFGMWPEAKPKILHKCDNTRCVNPNHLFAGTQAENVQDMISKGRQNFTGSQNRTKPPKTRKGEDVSWAKLDWNKVSDIRSRYAAGGVFQHQLASEYGVCNRTINCIILNRKWKVSNPA